MNKRCRCALKAGLLKEFKKGLPDRPSKLLQNCNLMCIHGRNMQKHLHKNWQLDILVHCGEGYIHERVKSHYAIAIEGS